MSLCRLQSLIGHQLDNILKEVGVEMESVIVYN
jgi:hypothetical protein